jgi:hypothetical protein
MRSVSDWLVMQLANVDSAHTLPPGHLPGLAGRIFVRKLRPRRVLERSGPHHGL